jgi:hypothetical protein
LKGPAEGAGSDSPFGGVACPLTSGGEVYFHAKSATKKNAKSAKGIYFLQFSIERPGIRRKWDSLFVAKTILFSMAMPAINRSISSTRLPVCFNVAYISAEIFNK